MHGPSKDIHSVNRQKQSNYHSAQLTKLLMALKERTPRGSADMCNVSVGTVERSNLLDLNIIHGGNGKDYVNRFISLYPLYGEFDRMSSLACNIFAPELAKAAAAPNSTWDANLTLSVYNSAVQFSTGLENAPPTLGGSGDQSLAGM